MKTFKQFITEADLKDKEGLGHGSGMTHRGGTKIGAERKKERGDMPSPHSKGDAKPRMKAIGGGKTAPAKEYKQRKQQPTRERGSAKLSAREAQRKAALERRAAKGDSKSKKDLEKAATKLLTKKKDTVDPKYKPAKASGYTRPERRKLQRAGDRLIGDIRKKKEKPAQHYNPKL